MDYKHELALSVLNSDVTFVLFTIAHTSSVVDLLMRRINRVLFTLACSIRMCLPSTMLFWASAIARWA